MLASRCLKQLGFSILIRLRLLATVIVAICVIVYYKNKSQNTDMVERIVCQLAQANENLTGNVLETILTANKVKEQICMC